jgi:Leucine-rich repeat (LRR) protein
MTALRSLDARLNCLCSLPDGLENLDNLETLNVSQNLQYLRELPYGIGLLVSLRELDVSYNSIVGDGGGFFPARRENTMRVGPTRVQVGG